MRFKVGFILSIVLMYFISFPSNIFASEYKEELGREWLFYHEELLISSNASIEEGILVNLPIEFDDLHLDIDTFGTFIKEISIPKDCINKQMGLEFPFVYSAAAIYIDGKKVEEVGKVGTNINEHQTDLKSVIIPFVPIKDKVEIVIQLSSFNHIRGGFSSAPIVGDWESIQEKFLLERYQTIIVGTMIFVVGLATLLIGLMNRNEKLLLTFGLFAIIVAIRNIVAVPFIYQDLPFDLSYILATRLEYITTTLCFSLYAIFIYLLYKTHFSKIVLYFNVIVLVSIAILATFTEPKFFQNIFFSVFPFMIFFVVYNIWIMYKALRLRLQLAKPLLLGVLFVFVGLIVDFLGGMGVVNTPPLASFMIMLNVLIVLFSLCENYVQQVLRMKSINIELDDLVKKRTEQLYKANEELKKAVNIDALTGIYNRHKFNETIKENFQHTVNQKTYLSLIMLDIDEYKSYNDRYGHVAGDDLLIKVTNIIKDILPENSIFSRYGGEEFSILLAGYSLEETKVLAEQIRVIIENERIENLGRTMGIVTVSIGCAERITNKVSNERELIKVSDDRLYISKARGRNKVTA